MSVRKSVRKKENNKMSTMNKMILVIGLTIVFVYVMVCVRDFMIGFVYGYELANEIYKEEYLYEDYLEEDYLEEDYLNGIEINEIEVKPIEVNGIEIKTISAEEASKLFEEKISKDEFRKRFD